MVEVVESGSVNECLSFSVEELNAIARSINNELAGIESISDRLPITPGFSQELCDKLSDGLIGIHLLNKIDPDRVDLRTIN